ncbi:DNA translocase FtsK [Aquamicrobium defluvii]|uniref:Cell division protein FtsK n=1 Tax=Aquamicrobium defluvii TaxID=69279 RepID=A0A011UTI8_9HYPH|nr:cell division protein FtsK [Aquamicrobium defluvii]EZQ17401.1 cell division protein FtsK [Halopseudomonas bauzanensis]TDR37638.1 DNA translocase FtsK [Aquamicrobium defluvii]
MRLSRANFSDMVSRADSPPPRSDETRAPSVQPSAPQAPASRMVNLNGTGASYVQPKGAGEAFPNFGGPEGEFARPTYQNYFFLAPNVRFTRTPDREIRKLRDDDGHGEPSGEPVPVGNRPVGLAPVAAAPAAAGRPEPAAVPRASARQAVAAERCVEPIRTVGAQPAAGPVVEAEAESSAGTDGRADSHWACISDHAFFEFVAENTVDVPSRAGSAAPVAAAARLSAAPFTPVVRNRSEPMPRARIAPSALQNADITTLYRVIECAVTGRAFDAQPKEAKEAAPAPVQQTPAAVAEAPAIQPEVKVEERPEEVVAVEPAAEVSPVRAARSVEITMPAPRAPALPKAGRVTQVSSGGAYEFPSEELLQEAPEGQGFYMSQERLEQNADLLESVLEDFGVRGEIIHVRPGPVVTLYEFEPAPGVKSSRVINLAEDIARSMSAISARVAVVPGRNVIGIELPNETRETVYFREMIESQDFRKSSAKLAVCLGKTIGGEPVIAELAKMPHLLVAGTTGSGKSVAINTMILSLLYRLKPEECRLIMVDPKMLELSVYDGIPHLLTPVVTDPKKAVTALKWAVREMEDRYRKMAKLGVRNIDGYNQRAAAARDKGETVVMQVQTGFEKGTGEPLFEEQEIDLSPMPYIVVIVDEMADLMMVAGKEIEGAIQRLAQMARAAGIHLIMATQRPSVDVITGTIKANFPTRISFQVTSKIDSRTILGEQGAEQLLGQGDMLHMAGGGRIARVHGPFVSDDEVEQVVAHLKTQGRPEYLETVTADEDEEEPEADDGAVFDKSAMGAEDGDGLFEEAVKVVMRDKKCSTSYIQRRLGVGYNRAASLVERMEKEGLVGAPNHVGKREILIGRTDRAAD